MALTTIPASLSATALTLTTAAQPNITSVGTLTGLTVSGNIAGTLTTAAQTNITSVGTLSALTTTGSLTSTGGHLNLSSDGAHIYIGADSDMRISHDGSNGTFRNDTGNLTVDVGGDITLDADGGDILFKDGGTHFGSIYQNSNNMLIYSANSDADMLFQGNDGGSLITALTLDMSEGGNATFSGNLRINSDSASASGTKSLQFYRDSVERGRVKFDFSNSSLNLQADGIMTFMTTGENERMRIDSTGNVGIGTGTTAPAAPLHIQFSNNDGGVGGHLIKNTNTGTTSNFASLSTQAVNGTIQGTFGSAHYSTWGNAIVFAGSQTNHPFKILTNNGVKATFDTSGHVGIGISPPAQDFGKYLTVNTANLIGNGTSGGYVGANQYYDGAWKYQVAAGSALISFENDGDVTIRQAASGSANGTITYSENFHLDAAGHLGLGMDPSQALDINASDGLSLRFYESGTFRAGMQLATTGGQMIGTTAAQDFAIRSQSDMVFSAGGNTERMRIKSNGQITAGVATDYKFVDVVYRRTYSINKAYTHVANINGSSLGSSYEVHVRGTTNSVVVNSHFHIMVGHYYDIAIKSFGGAYTYCKVKVVSNGNEDSSLYIGINSANNGTAGLLVSIRPHDSASVDMSPSTAYSTCYLEHAQTATSTQETTTGSATGGSGPTNAYS